MNLPITIQQTLETLIEARVVDGGYVGGGSINQTAWINLSDNRQLLIKWRLEKHVAAQFAAEKTGLELLQSTRTVRIPDVVAFNDNPPFLALEWLGQGAKSAVVAEALGRGLADLHRVTGPHYGLDSDNFIGSTPQINQPADNWVSFFAEHRLGYQMELAGRNGYLLGQRKSRLAHLITRLDEWLPAHPPASLLHGDLWGGNWIVTTSKDPALIDPAVYYGHREADLAFTEVFGGFSPAFYRAYNTTWPLEPGYDNRKDLYNLYHLLNHLNLFGEGYGSSVDAILRQYT